MTRLRFSYAVLLALIVQAACSGEPGGGSLVGDSAHVEVTDSDQGVDLALDRVADQTPDTEFDAGDTSNRPDDDAGQDTLEDASPADVTDAGDHDVSGDSAEPDVVADAPSDSSDTSDAPDRVDSNDADETDDGGPTDSSDAMVDTVGDTEIDSASDEADTSDGDGADDVPCDIEYPDHTVGLMLCAPEVSEGYTLFAPLRAGSAYLIDVLGRLVHSWELAYWPGMAVYLLEDGSLLVTGSYSPSEEPRLSAGGQGGIVQIYDWDGNLTWSYTYSNDDHRQHHDVEMLPNGNVLLIAWEYKTEEEADEAGRTRCVDGDGLWPDVLIEVKPTGPVSGEIVWEWRAWDHIVQDTDSELPNFGDPAEHPELIDINYQIGFSSDWLHTNAVDYNPEFDQILLSVHNTGEMWIIDHSTTTEEAAQHTGGDGGRGGDLLYRWGNPAAYGAGTGSDQQLFGQHDTQWIEAGRPGAGNVLVFDNGLRRSGRYSRIVEVETPGAVDGSYPLTGDSYGPEAPVWTYQADPPSDFFAANLSGAQRMPNGNTLICAGRSGQIFEVTASGDVVWSYINPVTGSGPITQGETASGTGAEANQAVFRAYRYVPSYPGFSGRELIPGDVIEL